MNNKRYQFKGKIALITGATGFGIGTATAIELLKRGAFVYLNGVKRNRINEVLISLGDLSKNAFPAKGDVSKKNEVNELMKKIIGTHGRIDILVNNAARGAPNLRIDHISDEIWDEDISTILNGSFFVTRSVVPTMLSNKYGKIIFVSSSAAWRGTWGRAVSYSAAKAALIGMTKRLALELGEFNINVNAVLPSQIDTPRVRREGRRTEESMHEYAIKNVPLRRVGMPEDVAYLIAFLASDEASYITGQSIMIDGGASLASKYTMPRK